MLVDIDSKHRNEFIIEELDEEHLLVKESKIGELKMRLQTVSLRPGHLESDTALTIHFTDVERAA